MNDNDNDTDNDTDTDTDTGGYTTLEQADELAACSTCSRLPELDRSTGRRRRRTWPRSAALRRY